MRNKNRQMGVTGIGIRLVIVLGAGFYFFTHLNLSSPALTSRDAPVQVPEKHEEVAGPVVKPPADATEPQPSVATKEYYSYTDSKGILHLGNIPQQGSERVSQPVTQQVQPQVPLQKALPVHQEMSLPVPREKGASLQTVPRPNLALVAMNAAAKADTNMNVFESCRCKNGLATKGDQRLEVLQKCGQPVAQQPTRRSGCREIWLYNFGPNEFMQGICFEDSRVNKVLSLDYGY